MRYTTVIDISQDAALYRNINVRLLYLHMALKSGYHDDDRDQLRASIRNLAADTGLTVSATRHALRLLANAQLISRDGEIWRIKKWIIDTPPTPRPRKQQAAAAKDAGKIGEQRDQQISEYQQSIMNAVRMMNVEELELWKEELAAGKSLRHHRAQMNANAQNVAWLAEVIKNKRRNG